MNVWPIVSIKDCARVVGGATPKSGAAEYWDGDIPWITPKDLSDLNGKYISDTPRKITASGLRSCSSELLPANSVLFSSRAPIGHVAINAVPMATNQGFKSFIPSPKLDASFLFWWLKCHRAQLELLGNGATFKEVSKAVVERIEIPLPPLDEQKRIAAILDQADELRRKRERAVNRLKKLGQAIFFVMFGDPRTNPRELPWAQLGKIADFYSGNSLPEGEPFTDQRDGHLLLKVSDLNHDLNQQDIVCAANWSLLPGSRAGTCPPNSLIFPKRGGAIGTNKKRWLRRSAILDPNLMGVHPNETDLTMPFLNGWFQTFNLTDIASGSSVPQLNKQDLAPLEIALPPVSEQLEYGLRMKALANARQGFIHAADYDSQLFSVIQHRAFRGEL